MQDDLESFSYRDAMLSSILRCEIAVLKDEIKKLRAYKADVQGAFRFSKFKPMQTEASYTLPDENFRELRRTIMSNPESATQQK